MFHDCGVAQRFDKGGSEGIVRIEEHLIGIGRVTGQGPADGVAGFDPEQVRLTRVESSQRHLRIVHFDRVSSDPDTLHRFPLHCVTCSHYNSITIHRSIIFLFNSY